MNADNLWLEWFVESGIIGTIALVIALILMVFALHRLNQQVDPIDHGLATAGWFILGSIGVSQLFDFGARIPSNAMALTVFASATLSRAALMSDVQVAPVVRKAKLSLRPAMPQAKSKSALFPVGRNLWRSVTALVVFLGLLASLGFSISNTQTLAKTDHLVRVTRSLPRGVQLDIDLARQVLGLLEEQQSLGIDEPRLLLEQSRLSVDIARYQIAKNTVGVDANDWYANYQSLSPSRLRSIWYLVQMQPGPSKANENPTADVSNSSSGVLEGIIPKPLFPIEHGGISFITYEKTSNSANERLNQERVQFGVSLARARMLAAKALSLGPLADDAQIALVRLDFAGGSSKQSERLIECCENLRSRNARSQLVTGQLAAQAGMWDLAVRSWKLGMSIDPAVTSSVIQDYPEVCPIPLIDVLPQDASVLEVVAKRELAKTKHDKQILLAAARTLQSTVNEALPSTERLKLLARIYDKLGQLNLATETLAKAVQYAPSDRDIRYAYALSLRASGSTVEARAQARIGRQLDTTDNRFSELLSALNAKE